MSIIDIGSNSIRLVVYEGLARSPTMLFNEKMLAGLGRGIVSTGKLDPELAAGSQRQQYRPAQHVSRRKTERPPLEHDPEKWKPVFG